MIFLRKFLSLISTTFLTALFLTILSVILEGTNPLVISMFITGAFPFILVIGVPVSFLSDCVTKKLDEKPRYIVALLIHSIFGLIAGLVIRYLFENEGLLLVGITIIAACIFWLVDELLRKNFKKRG